MTGPVPSGDAGRFSPGELEGVSGIRSEDLAVEVRVARELEAVAAGSAALPTAGFADRVMGAIANEPSPAPVRAAGAALRHGALGALLLSIRDAWRVTTRSGFPMAVRAQAMALVLVVVAVGAGSAPATAGALGMFRADQTPPGPDPSLVVPGESDPATFEVPSASVDGVETPSAEPSVLAEPSATPTEEPSGSDVETDEPRETDDGNSGPGSTDDDRGSTPKPDDTPEPDDTPKPDDTPEPDDTPDSDDSGSGSDDSGDD